MEVYIEYVILDNFCVDFVLLCLVAKVLSVKLCWWKVLLACLFGTAAAVVIPLFSLPLYVSIPLKVAVGAIVSAIFLIGQPWLVNVIGFVFLMVFTFALGGMTLGFIYLITKSPVSTFAVSYGGGLPIGLLVLALFFVMQFVLYLAKYIKERKNIGSFLRTIYVQIDGTKIELAGFLDSGNRLEDMLTGLPVLVVSKKALIKKMPPVWKQLIASSQLPPKLKPHYIQTETAVGKNKMLVFTPDWVHIGNEKKQALIGISTKSFSEVVKVDALFGAALA